MKRLLQLRLRTLLIGMTLASVLAWWFLYRPGLNTDNIGRLEVLRTLDESIWKLEWSPDGREAAFIRWEEPVEIRSTTTWRRIAEIGKGKKIVHFAFSPDPNLAAYCENGGQAVLLNRSTGVERTLPTPKGQNKLAFNADGSLLATGTYGDEAHVWDVATGAKISTCKMSATGGLNLDFHPDGKRLAVGNRNGPAYLFDARTGKELACLSHGRDNCHRVAFDPTGQLLAISYADGIVRLWDVENKRLINAKQTQCDDLYSVHWSGRGDMLVTTGNAGAITIWRPDLSILCQRKAPDWVIVGKFTPDGGRILTAGGSTTNQTERKVRIWGVRTAAAWPQ